MRTLIMAILVGMLATACGIFPERVKYKDPRLEPMWDAVAVVTQRVAWGFTPIEKDADIRLEHASRTYDAMLHIGGRTGRTLAFRKSGNHYIWIGEQEIHTGPLQYTTVDGTFFEQITITYEIQPISGFPLNRVNVSYDGPRTNLVWPRQLTLTDVEPLMEQWDKR